MALLHKLQRSSCGTRKRRHEGTCKTEVSNGELEDVQRGIEDAWFLAHLAGPGHVPAWQCQIALALGRQATGLVDMAKFTVDEVDHSGTHDSVTLRARSANLIDTFKQQEHSFTRAPWRIRDGLGR